MFKPRFNKRTSSILSLCLLAALTLPARSVFACGGEWMPALMEREPDRRPVLIPLAEKALEEGRTVAAAGLVIRVIPHINSLKPASSKIVERAQRVLAVALARSDGKLAIGLEVPEYAQGTWLGKTDADRTKNLHFAVNTLRAVNDAKKDDPGVQTELAEAMARLPELRPEARTLLEKLAEKDLVASAEGYKVLAELRSDAGDTTGGKVALLRCQKMSKAKGLCPATSDAAS